MAIGDRQGPHLRPDCRVNIGNRRNAVEQGPEIKAGASHQDRAAASGLSFGDAGRCFSRPARGGVDLRCADMTEKPVWNLGLVGWRRAR